MRNNTQSIDRKTKIGNNFFTSKKTKRKKTPDQLTSIDRASLRIHHFPKRAYRFHCFYPSLRVGDLVNFVRLIRRRRAVVGNWLVKWYLRETPQSKRNFVRPRPPNRQYELSPSPPP